MEEAVRWSEEVEVEDGTRLGLEHVCRADAAADAPLLLCLPAMGVEARYYRPFALELARHGLHLVSGDLRGHGTSSVRAGRGTRFGYHQLVALDLEAMVATERRSHPERPVFLLGHSLGGQLAALFAARHPERVRGIVLVAACSVYHRGYPGLARAGVLLATQAAALLATAWGYFPGRRLRFAGNESAGVMRDWARQARTGRYDLEGTEEDHEGRLAGLELPLLAVSVDNDRLAPPSAIDHLCAKLPGARLTRWHYGATEAGPSARLDHFRWVRHGAPLAAYVRAWVAGVLGRP